MQVDKLSFYNLDTNKNRVYSLQMITVITNDSLGENLENVCLF